MAGNDMFGYGPWKNVNEFQRFGRRKDAMDIASALIRSCVGGYCVVGLYNQERLHQALGYRTPAEVYFGVPAGPAVALRAPSVPAGVIPGINPSKKSLIFV
jgi:hypothetical protein